MRKRLIKIGASLAIIIDKPMLRRLQIDGPMEVDMDVRGDALIITPVRDSEDRRRR